MPYLSSEQLGRRAFLQHGALILSAAAGLHTSHSANASANDAPDGKPLKIGLITDLHYADKPPAGTRHYRETLDKLAEAAEEFHRNALHLTVELGDLIDAADSVQTELNYLKRVNAVFSQLPGERYYVLGNHCVDTLRKGEFLDTVGQEQSYYSFDRGGLHFVALDACFRSDGVAYERKNFHWTDANIPQAELDWLKADLAATQKPVVVFAHQRLDVDNNHAVKNAAEVRRVLEDSKKVTAVFQGHSHQNDYRQRGGIHYCTLVAMVEGAGLANNGYSVLEAHPDGTLKLHGFRKQQDHTWPDSDKS